MRSAARPPRALPCGQRPLGSLGSRSPAPETASRRGAKSDSLRQHGPPSAATARSEPCRLAGLPVQSGRLAKQFVSHAFGDLRAPGGSPVRTWRDRVCPNSAARAGAPRPRSGAGAAAQHVTPVVAERKSGSCVRVGDNAEATVPVGRWLARLGLRFQSAPLMLSALLQRGASQLAGSRSVISPLSRAAGESETLLVLR